MNEKNAPRSRTIIQRALLGSGRRVGHWGRIKRDTAHAELATGNFSVHDDESGDPLPLMPPATPRCPQA